MVVLFFIGNIVNIIVKLIFIFEVVLVLVFQNFVILKIVIIVSVKIKELVFNVIYVYDGFKLFQIYGRIEKASIFGFFFFLYNIIVFKDCEGILVDSDLQVIIFMVN